MVGQRLGSTSVKQCFKCCVAGVLMNSEHVQLSAQYQTNEHSSLDERENHKVPHLAEELLENDGFWGEKKNISFQGCGTCSKQTMLPVFQWMALCPSTCGQHYMNSMD